MTELSVYQYYTVKECYFSLECGECDTTAMTSIPVLPFRGFLCHKHRICLLQGGKLVLW